MIRLPWARRRPKVEPAPKVDPHAYLRWVLKQHNRL